ncbi:Dihydroxyacetone kinase family protein [Serinicoccus hydrothermalis]|uniref:Dihydroxyacetone kinase family protein n=1 Tax=Serinicoccus hydrothermalis TaxID=1758689 RepID=A0A1B1NGV1_9MICO|nr:DAK2 domain-containing protein [Serinicoccus hydrothermalis]ANS80640.1 Dihydroxyacetone kinase family protein [Serinicoccus hydrothermalis]
MPGPVLDLVTARRWAITARLSLAAAREQIDALNVFPVADGDTGTNMYRTLDGALDHVRVQFESGGGTDRLREGLALIARGMLLAARGNSGVILAQLTRGLADAVAPDVEEAGPDEVATAFESAARSAWDALAAPVEGTILTVARAAADGARAAVDEGATEVLTVVDAALAAAQEALARTPDQLPELRDAGVVDAGGAGLVLVVEALHAVLAERPVGADGEVPPWWSAAPVRPRADATGSEEQAVEVMFLLRDSDPERAERLRAHLTHLGDSVVVAGGPQEFQVHVHLEEEDTAAAIEAGGLAGTVSEVRQTSLTGDHEGVARGSGTSPLPRGIGVVSCVLGAGVEELMAAAGAVLVPSGPRQRAAAGEVLAAVRACDGAAVVVLPNDHDMVMVARAAAAEARREGLEVEVVPTRTLLEGMAALAVLDPDGRPDQVASAMGSAASAVHGGALTRADRGADTPAGPCRPGQWLGIVDHGIVAVEDDLGPAASSVLDQMWHPGVELLTVLLGEDADDDVRRTLERAVEEQRSGTEVETNVLDGGQPTYTVLLGVE